MCLAVPGRIVQLHDNAQATIDMMGVTRDISVRLTPEAQVDDYVLVHAGYGIEIVEEAHRMADRLKERNGLFIRLRKNTSRETFFRDVCCIFGCYLTSLYLSSLFQE